MSLVLQSEPLAIPSGRTLSSHHDLSELDRAKFINWFHIVVTTQQVRRESGKTLYDEVFYYAVMLFDKYLSVCEEKYDIWSVRLVAATSVWLATKYTDDHYEFQVDFCQEILKNKYTNRQYIDMMYKMCETLKWTFFVPTVSDFVDEEMCERYGKNSMKEWDLFRNRVNYMLEMLILTSHYWTWKPSTLAVAAIVYASSTEKSFDLTLMLGKRNSQQKKDILQCALKLRETHTMFVQKSSPLFNGEVADRLNFVTVYGKHTMPITEYTYLDKMLQPRLTQALITDSMKKSASITDLVLGKRKFSGETMMLDGHRWKTVKQEAA